jgi:hypothetical protein
MDSSVLYAVLYPYCHRWDFWIYLRLMLLNNYYAVCSVEMRTCISRSLTFLSICGQCRDARPRKKYRGYCYMFDWYKHSPMHTTSMKQPKLYYYKTYRCPVAKSAKTRWVLYIHAQYERYALGCRNLPRVLSTSQFSRLFHVLNPSVPTLPRTTPHHPMPENYVVCPSLVHPSLLK